MPSIWRAIPEFPGYDVSDAGDVRSFKHTFPRILIPSRHSKGYLYVHLCRAGQRFKRYVHRLVALVFCGAPAADEHRVNHRDHDPANNRAHNLEWITPAANNRHRRPAWRAS